jgi:hypothetical protein
MKPDDEENAFAALTKNGYPIVVGHVLGVGRA